MYLQPFSSSIYIYILNVVAYALACTGLFVCFFVIFFNFIYLFYIICFCKERAQLAETAVKIARVNRAEI